MDRRIERPSKKRKAYVIGGATAVFLIMLSVYVSSVEWGAKVVRKDNIRIGTVYKGDLVVEVVGSGRVLPFGLEWIVARMPGVITDVRVESGDVVEEGQVLVELANTEIDAQLAQQESKLAEAKAILSGMEFDLAAREMEYESAALEAKYNYEADRVIYEAFEKLMDLENSPVSELEFYRAKIAAERQQQIYQAAQRQYENFVKLKHAQLEQYRSRVEFSEHERDQYRSRVEDLKVRAKKSGVVQDFDLKVGQQLTAGENVGKIVDPSALYVRLELPAIEAHKVAKGLPARIEVNRNSIDGVVTRIDPNIKGTVIEADVSLEGDTSSVKVDMFVNGRIIVAEVADTLIAPRPETAVEQGLTQVYRLDPEGDKARLTSVQTGILSSNEMQVNGGLSAGDRIVLSELRGMRGTNSILID